MTLFPALDCFSVFPLNVVFVANNVMAALGDSWHTRDTPRTLRVAFRLGCCVPSLACAALLPSLSGALAFTGIVGIALPFVVTPLLHVASRRRCEARWGAGALEQAEARAGLRTSFGGRRVVVLTAIAGAALFLHCVAADIKPLWEVLAAHDVANAHARTHSGHSMNHTGTHLLHSAAHRAAARAARMKHPM